MSVDGYLALAVAGDHRAAARHAVALVDSGQSVATVIDDLLRPAQVEVGRRWQTAHWTVADEHVATNVTDTVLAAITDTRAVAREPRGRFVLVCAEQEWHLLPARMAAEQLRLAGWEVTFLGGSVPGDALRSFLESRQVDVVGVSASVPLHLPGAGRSIEAAHAAGLPVVAGGRGYGPEGRWAPALGADGWAPDGESAATVASELLGRPLAASPPRNEVFVTMTLERDRWVTEAMEALQVRLPVMARFSEAQLARTREDLAYQLDFLAVAALVDDPMLFESFLLWLVDVLAARGVPASAMTAGIEVIAALVEPVSGRWASAARDAAEIAVAAVAAV